jgi:hypothetical protein
MGNEERIFMEENNKWLSSEERSLYADMIYKMYPRKEGKSAGIKKLKEKLKTVDQVAKFSKAVENYKKKLARDCTPTQYTLLFSTFVNGRWEDYLEVENDIPSLPHFKLLEPLGLQFRFASYSPRILQLWPTEDQFLNHLINIKNLFSRNSEDLNFDQEKFKAYVAVAISKDLGI